jgi:GNAT superfamily N-acetyltransferase
VQLTRLDPEHLTEQDVSDATEFFAAVHAVDRPEWPPTPRAGIEEQLRSAHLGTEPAAYWLGRLEDGRLAAIGVIRLPQAENTELAPLDVRVHPQLRRQGLGEQTLRLLVAQAREAGRTRLMGGQLREGGPGLPWSKRFGFEPVHGYIVQDLQIAETDPALWDVPVPPGYQLRDWIGPTPEDVIESYAAARRAISDAPTGEMTFEDPRWSPERVREDEAEVAAKGAEQRIVVAIHEATGAVAGITELFTSESRPKHAQQGDTAVLAAHRGRGLGRAMKAAMMRRLVRERPELEYVSTQTAADNKWMAQVNHQIGYRTLWTHFYAEADTDLVQERLSA